MSSNKKYVPPNMRNGNGNGNSTSVNSITQRSRPVVFDISKESFPEFGNKKNEENHQKNYDSGYLSVLSQEVENSTQEKENKVLPGWVSITFDENKKVIYKYGQNTSPLHEEKTMTFHEEATIAFSKMINRWEKYKNNYKSLYGEDAYKHFFSEIMSKTENLSNDDHLSDDDNNHLSDNDDDYYRLNL